VTPAHTPIEAELSVALERVGAPLLRTVAEALTPGCAASAGAAAANTTASAAASSAAARHAVRGNRSHGSAPGAAERAARASMCMDMTLLAGSRRTLA